MSTESSVPEKALGADSVTPGLGGGSGRGRGLGTMTATDGVPRQIGGPFWTPEMASEEVVARLLTPAFEAAADNVSEPAEQQDTVFTCAMLWVHEVLKTTPPTKKRLLCQNAARVTLDFLEEMK